MGYNPHGRARISASQPRALGICDQCGFQYSLADLRWQYQWQGTQLQNLRYLVCRECYDEPQPQLRTIVLPPDPIPKMNPRPDPYSSEVPSYRTTDAGDIRGTEDGNPRILEGTQAYSQP